MSFWAEFAAQPQADAVHGPVGIDTAERAESVFGSVGPTEPARDACSRLLRRQRAGIDGRAAISAAAPSPIGG